MVINMKKNGKNNNKKTDQKIDSLDALDGAVSQLDNYLDSDSENQDESEALEFFEDFLLFLIETGLTDEEIILCCEMIDVDGRDMDKEQIDFIENILGFETDIENDTEDNTPSSEFIKDKVLKFYEKRKAQSA